MLNVKRAARLVLVLFACSLFSLRVDTARAQDLTLTLSDNTYAAYINTDGTVDIVQDLTFVVAPGSMALDYVDVGLPNDSYDLRQVRAYLDGASLRSISRSENIPHGVKVVLDRWIQPGQAGTLRVEARVSGVLYQDTEDENYASLVLSNTYFDGQYMRGIGRLEVQFHFPAGVTGDEPRWHEQEPSDKLFVDDRVVYAWIVENDSGTQGYSFGASFPKKYLDPGVQMAKKAAFTINFRKICSSPLVWIGGFAAGWAVLAGLGARAQKKRKMEYLPPAAAVEGAGIKRGLTAVEAAVLLEAPLNKVLTMILFGLVKKGVITVESDKPLNVKAVEPPPADTELWDYEQRFLKTIGPDGTPEEGQLRDLAVDLIGDVNKKLAGFSREETKTYYKDIAARAWQQVEAAETPEVLGKNWSDGLEWTMLDDDWNDHTRRVFEDRPVVLPTWWWAYRPWGLPAGTPSQPSVPVPSPAGGGTTVTLPTLPGADFANTVVGGIEKAANTVVSSIERFTGGVAEKTNPLPKISSSSSSSRRSGGGGGYSCACACACAGCACACAGGGR